MSLVGTPEKILFAVFLLATMLGLGARTTVRELRAVVARPGLLARTLLANFVVVPLVGLALVLAVRLAPPVEAAILLLACLPGGISAIQFTSKVKGEESLAAATLVTLCALAVVVSPLILGLVHPADVKPMLPYGKVFGLLLAGILLPLAVGLTIAERAPGRVALLSKLCTLIGVAAFIAFMVVTKSIRKEALAGLDGPAVPVMIALILISMAAGWLLGGPSRSDRQVLATVTSVRNAALCLAIADDVPGGAAAIPAILAFSLLMITPNTVLTLGSKLLARRRSRTGAHA